MRVLVDTSVWADFFNGHDSAEARTLARLIADEDEVLTCGVVVAEVFQGLRADASRSALEVYFREMPYLATRDPDTWLEAAALFRGLRRQGVTIRSTIDCVVARLAEEHDVLLLAKDRDIRFILESGLCAARAAPLTP